jgi:hypothetical protein
VAPNQPVEIHQFGTDRNVGATVTRTFVLRGGEPNSGREHFAAARMNGVAESVLHFATPMGSPGCRHFTGISQVLMRSVGASFFSDFSGLAQTVHHCYQCL